MEVARVSKLLHDIVHVINSRLHRLPHQTIIQVLTFKNSIGPGNIGRLNDRILNLFARLIKRRILLLQKCQIMPQLRTLFGTFGKALKLSFLQAFVFPFPKLSFWLHPLLTIFMAFGQHDKLIDYQIVILISTLDHGQLSNYLAAVYFHQVTVLLIDRQRSYQS